MRPRQNRDRRACVKHMCYPQILLAVGLLAAQGVAPVHALTLAGLSSFGRLDLDTMSNFSGGLQSRLASSVLLQWSASLDATAAGWWPGGHFDFSLEGVRSDGNLLARTGAIQLPSNEWAPNFLRVYQLTYAQDMGSARLRTGIMDLNQYFEASDVADLLHNGTFGMSPNFTANINDPSFPSPGLGLMGNWRVASGWQARAGIWQGNPPGLAGALREGALSIGEVERDWGAGSEQPTTDLKLGAWHAAHAPGSGFGATTSGAYVVGETRWQAAGRSWGAFALAGSSPAQGNLVTEFAATGLLLTGLLPQRPLDQFSLGFGRVQLHAPAPETFVEAVYSWQLSSALYLQPDLQWFDHPGGTNPGAWVGGLRMHLGF